MSIMVCENCECYYDSDNCENYEYGDLIICESCYEELETEE